MKKACIAGMVFLGCFMSQFEVVAQSQESTKEVKMEQMDNNTYEIHLTVEGMSCQAGCADGIDKMLGKQEGVSKSKTTYTTGLSVIWYDKKVISEKEILALISEKGFKATVSKGDED